MKLLFDQNLSPALVERLADVYPESQHLQQIGMERTTNAIESMLRSSRDVIVQADADQSTGIVVLT